MNIKILDEAAMELDDAFNYYQYEQENLGYRFINKFTDAIELIKFYPNGWHQLSKKLRRCLIKNFPYGIIYQIKENEIIIVAVANLHRKPNYWVNRI
ncbi:MAG: type II toxin-antitoxin system RelE/ParE family toxin [Arcobacteraceae bacterium]|jgi:hypothetical protein|nr:type II toxin-antitoxin system RelE/ParE family toxin [Arcobacteraceae bacterium]